MPSFTTRSGVVLTLRAVPSLAVIAAQKQLKKPQVPVFRNTEKNRDEPNPGDPNYVQAMEEYNTEINELTTNTLLANGIMGIDFSNATQEYRDINSPLWVEGLEFVGIVIPESGIGRKIAWLRYHVLDDADVGNIIGAIAIAGGVITEEQVAGAVDSFRDNEAQPTATQLSLIQ